MKRGLSFLALACAAGLAASAHGAVTFTFFDPATGPEITYVEGSDNVTDPGEATWTGSNVALTVDGTDEGLGQTTFANTAVSMFLEVGAVEGQEGGTFIAPILSGMFSFTDMDSGMTLLTATMGAEAGAVLALGTTGNIIAQGGGGAGGLTFTAGSGLAAFLGGLTLGPIFDANFTLTNIDPAATLSDNDFLEDFEANSAFTGNAEVIPSPGAIALAGLSLLTFAASRKR